VENILKLRESADFLYKYSHYDEAYYVYNQVNYRIWFALGFILTEINKFSSTFFSASFKTSLDFKNEFSVKSAESVFRKWFDLDLDQVWNELLFTTYYEIQCINNSDLLTSQIPQQKVIEKFLIVYFLINNAQEKWVNNLLRVFTPVMKEYKLEKLRVNLAERDVQKSLIDQAGIVKKTDWEQLNIDLLEYLNRIKEIHSKFYTDFSAVAGFYRKRTEKKAGSSEERTNQNYEKYERYEKYEKYEKYERYDNNQQKKEFNPKNATEFEKENYYGKILGLQGKLTRLQIRKKFLELVSKYHPDKVNDLGEEFIVMAEEKTRQIIEAYDWIKNKYGI